MVCQNESICILQSKMNQMDTLAYAADAAELEERMVVKYDLASSESASRSISPSQDHHPLKQQTQSQPIPSSPPKHIFSCTLESSSQLISLLKSLQLEKNQMVRLTMLPAGLKMTTIKCGVVLAKAYMRRALFSVFELASEEGFFECSVPLNTLIQCISLFSSQSRLLLSVGPDAEFISLILEDAGVVSECEVACHAILDENSGDSSENDDSNRMFDFRTASVVTKCVVQSSFLRTALNECDIAMGQSVVSVRMASNGITFTVTSESLSVDVTMPSPQSSRSHDLPAEGSRIFSEFECTESVFFHYPPQFIKPCLKALSQADHTNLRINAAGMMSFQHVIVSRADQISNWIEHIVLPTESN